MNLVYKVKANSLVPWRQSVDREAEEAYAALSRDQQAMIDATCIAMNTLLAEESARRERDLDALRERCTGLQSQIDMLRSLVEAKSAAIDLPPLPRKKHVA
jgi:hypothetical protein